MTLEPLLPAASPATAHPTVHIGSVAFGGSEVPVIAGPCSVEPGYVEHALAARAAGAAVLRGCVFKPRTRPGSFQGLGVAGLALLDEARAAAGMPVLAEPLCGEQVEQLLGHVDALQIGARSMQNTPLLRSAGQSGLPVILKRAASATYEEWLGAAEYITAEGNPQVILCERGIRTFESATRNTLDVSAVPVLRERTGLPVIVDPSHAAGRRGWVASLALAAVAAGADGLLIESHPLPAAAWSDADQVVDTETLAEIVRAAGVLAAMVRRVPVNGIDGCRDGIDAVDGVIGMLLERRAALVRTVHAHKLAAGSRMRDGDRERAVVERVALAAPSLGRDGAAMVMNGVIEACLATVIAARSADAA